jgi:membrane-bound serine protease (ClpP class)
MGLLLGLWVGVAAFYIPGTGIMEVLAFGLIGAAMLILLALPTNWLAVFILMFGVATFLLIPLMRPALASYAEVGLVFQAFGGYLLFNPGEVSILLVAATVALSWLYSRYLLVPMLKMNHREASLSDEYLVGMTGRVVKDLDPIGTVHVNGEMWTARSRVPLKSGTEIEVIEKRGLELIVEKAKRHEKSPVNDRQ